MRIKELREEKHLRQIDVANAIGTSQTNIGRWENGINEPAPSFVTKLADFFEVSVDYLLGRTDDLGTVIPSSAPSRLSLEEQKLLEGYRELPPNLKQTIQELIEFGSQSKSKKRKGAGS